MKLLIFHCAIVLISGCAFSQAPFELENRKALKLTENRLQMLMNKEWRVKKVETYNRGNTDVSTFSNFGRIKYNPDWTFNCNNLKCDGAWTIIEGKYIRHRLERQDEIKKNFGGTYAVTFLSDTTLVLTKVLTSSKDMKRVIHLTLEGRWEKKSSNPSYKHRLYYERLTSNQIDSISRLSSETLFEWNFKFTKDSIFFPTWDSLYKIKRGFRD